jgi:hypothetical protein
MADSAETGIAVTVGPRTSAARLLNAEYLRFVITANASPALSLMQTALLILILVLPLRVEGGRRGEETSQRELRQRVAAEEKEGLRRLSQSPAVESSARQAQLPGLVLHDLRWSRKIRTLKIDKNRFRISTPS